MQPDPKTLTRMINLAWELRTVTGKPCAEIMRHVNATRTMRDLGQTGDGKLDQAQAIAACRILERWVAQAKERRRQEQGGTRDRVPPLSAGHEALKEWLVERLAKEDEE